MLCLSDLSGYYMTADRFDEAKATISRAEAQNPNYPGVHDVLYNLAFHRGDNTEMARQLAWSVSHPTQADYALFRQSDTEARLGQLQKLASFHGAPSRRLTITGRRRRQLFGRQGQHRVKLLSVSFRRLAKTQLRQARPPPGETSNSRWP